MQYIILVTIIHRQKELTTLIKNQSVIYLRLYLWTNITDFMCILEKYILTFCDLDWLNEHFLNLKRFIFLFNILKYSILKPESFDLKQNECICPNMYASRLGRRKEMLRSVILSFRPLQNDCPNTKVLLFHLRNLIKQHLRFYFILFYYINQSV